MKHATSLLATALLVALVLGTGAPVLRAGVEVELDEAELFFEINDTDGDGGIQVFLDGEGWDQMFLFDPDGVMILDIGASSSVGMQGITELFFESAEPSFDDQPLEDLLALFPEGTYTFEGTTTEGDTLVGEAELTHALPEAPEQVSPVDGDSVDPCDAVLEWELVDDPEGSEIVGYKVIAETDDDEVPLRVIDIDVTPDTQSVTLPAEFLLPGAYKWEVLAIEASHNQTISETEFEVEDDNDCDEDSDDDSDSDSDSHASKRHKG